MAKAGFVLNIIGAILVTITIYFILPAAWGIDLTSIPQSML